MPKEDLYINDGAIKKKPQDPKSRKIKNILFILCLILVISGFIVGLHALQVQTSNTVTLENSNFQLPEGTTVDDSNNKNNNIVTLKTYDGDGSITVMENTTLTESDFQDYIIEDEYNITMSGIPVLVIETTNENYNEQGETDYQFTKNGIKYVISSTSSEYYVEDIIKSLKKNDR